MKKTFKILLIILLCLPILQINTNASMNLNVEKFGSISKFGEKICQPVTVSFVADGNWRLLVEPIDTKIRNMSSSSKHLPITRLELSETSGSPLVHFDMDKSYELKKGSLTGHNSLNFYVNVLNYEGDYPGVYMADLKFSLLNSSNQVVAEEIFTLRFNQEKIALVEFDSPGVNLNVSREKALERNYQEELKYPFSIYIKSNKDWKLYLIGKKTDDEKIFKYHYKVVGVSDGNIKSPSLGEYIPMRDTKMLVAQGKSTLDERSHQLTQQAISMTYMVKGPEGDIIPAGTTSEDFEYYLETEEN